MPTNAVIDASVLVSAYLFPESIPAQVLNLAECGVSEFHVSEIILEEVRRALQKPKLVQTYAYDPAHALAWAHALRGRLCIIACPLPDIQSQCRDPNDDHVLAAALVSGTHIIITGDADLLTLGSFQDIIIMNPRAYLKHLEPLGS